MKIRIGKQPHQCADIDGTLLRVQRGSAFPADLQLVGALTDGRRLWVTLQPGIENAEALGHLAEALREISGFGDIRIRTAVIDAVSQVMGAGAGVTQHEAGRVADQAVKLLNERKR